MGKLKNFFLKKDISTLFSLLGFVFLVIFFIAYLFTGITSFQENYSVSLIVVCILTMILSLLLTLFEGKVGRYIVFILGIYLLMEFINTQMTMIANVFTAIDGTTFSFGFILTLVSLVLSLAFSLISGIKSKEEEKLFLGENTK